MCIAPCARYVALLSLLTYATVASSASYDFYVSPSGSDKNPGTRDAPFGTLDRARLAVRELKKAKKSDITVGLRDGRYMLRDTVVFSVEDTGSPKQKITYEAIAGETPVLTSELPVEDWSMIKVLPKGVPVSVKGSIWGAALPQGAGRIKYMFKGDKVLPRSITKGFIPPVRYEGWCGWKDPVQRKTTPEPSQYMKVQKGIISDWGNVTDMELVIMPTCDWKIYNLPLVSYDPETTYVKGAFTSFYALGASKKRTWDGTPTAWFANCPEGMFKEGNWYVNTREGKIYLVAARKPEGITVPTLIEYVRVSGNTRQGGDDEVVENLHFKGLVFTKGKRYTWDREIAQLNWATTDVSSALLRFRNTRNCSVKSCRFENSGADGISLDLTSQDNRIEGNHFSRLVCTAVSLAGYLPGAKDVNFSNEIIGNHIHHTGEAYWGAPAISICQSGRNRIAHNLIHHVPYNGVRVWGTGQKRSTFIEDGKVVTLSKAAENVPLHSRDNVIEYNELHHVVEVLGDGNAFYVGKSGGHNIYRYNYIHHMTGTHASAAMRTDGVGTAKNISFIGNILHNVNKGGLVFKGEGHRAINNIFVDCFAAGSSKSWEGGGGWFEIRCGPSKGTILKNNIFYATANKRPTFMNAQVNMPSRFRGKGLEIEVEKTTQRGNICYAKADGKTDAKAVAAKSRKQGFKLEYRKITAISVAGGRVVLNPKDKLWREGYEYIDMSRIGLPEDFPKAWRKYDPVMSMKKYFNH